MCLAVPGRVEAIDGASALVDFGGVERVVQTSLLPDLRIGEYVLVHAGFAIQRLDPVQASATLSLLEEYRPDDSGDDPDGER